MEKNNPLTSKRVAIITNNLHCGRHVQYYATIEKYFMTNGWAISEDFNVNKIVICGCGFHDAMYEKIVLSLKEIRKTNFLEKNVIVMACLPRTHQKKLEKIFSGQLVYLNHEEKLDEIIDARIPYKEISPVNVFKANQQLKSKDLEYDKFHIKISQGCLCRCTFCVINKAKGYIKSIPIDQIENQVRIAIRSGKKKIKLMGEDTFAYGIDNGSSIVELVEHLTAIAPDIQLYFGYLHLMWLDKYAHQIVEFCKNGVLSELHLGLQHVNVELLEKMGRPTRFREMYELIKEIKKNNPNLYMVADIMVGFPGETEEMFNQLLEFFRHDTCFDKVKHFAYSDVEGSRSSKYGNKVPYEIITARWDQLDQVLGHRSYSHQESESRVDDETFRLTRFDDFSFCKNTFAEMIPRDRIPQDLALAKSMVREQGKGEFGF